MEKPTWICIACTGSKCISSKNTVIGCTSEEKYLRVSTRGHSQSSGRVGVKMHGRERVQGFKSNVLLLYCCL